MSWLGDFFGGPEKPKAGDAWTKLQRQQLLNPMVSQAGRDIRSMWNLGYNPYAYQGQYAAGPSSLQQQAWSMFPSVANQQMAGYQNIANSQAPMDAIYNYGQRWAQDVITPQVMNQFSGAGTADSGGASRALARELGTYGMGVQAQMAPLALQNQAQQLQALSGMSSIPTTMAGLGMDQYNVSANQLAGEQQKWNAMYNLYGSPAYGAGMNLLGLNNTAATQGQPAGLGYSMVQSGLGSLMNAGLGYLTGGLWG